MKEDRQEDSPHLGAGVWHQDDRGVGGGWLPGRSRLLLVVFVLEASILIQRFHGVLSFSKTYPIS